MVFQARAPQILPRLRPGVRADLFAMIAPASQSARLRKKQPLRTRRADGANLFLFKSLSLRCLVHDDRWRSNRLGRKRNNLSERGTVPVLPVCQCSTTLIVLSTQRLRPRFHDVSLACRRGLEAGTRSRLWSSAAQPCLHARSS